MKISNGTINRLNRNMTSASRFLHCFHKSTNRPMNLSGIMTNSRGNISDKFQAVEAMRPAPNRCQQEIRQCNNLMDNFLIQDNNLHQDNPWQDNNLMGNFLIQDKILCTYNLCQDSNPCPKIHLNSQIQSHKRKKKRQKNQMRRQTSTVTQFYQKNQSKKRQK